MTWDHKRVGRRLQARRLHVAFPRGRRRRPLRTGRVSHGEQGPKGLQAYTSRPTLACAFMHSYPGSYPFPHLKSLLRTRLHASSYDHIFISACHGTQTVGVYPVLDIPSNFKLHPLSAPPSLPRRWLSRRRQCDSDIVIGVSALRLKSTRQFGAENKKEGNKGGRVVQTAQSHYASKGEQPLQKPSEKYINAGLFPPDVPNMVQYIM